MLWQRTITQTNFQITSLLGLETFLMEFYHLHEKSNSQHGNQFFYLFEKAKYSCGKDLSTE